MAPCRGEGRAPTSARIAGGRCHPADRRGLRRRVEPRGEPRRGRRPAAEPRAGHAGRPERAHRRDVVSAEILPRLRVGGREPRHGAAGRARRPSERRSQEEMALRQQIERSDGSTRSVPAAVDAPIRPLVGPLALARPRLHALRAALRDGHRGSCATGRRGSASATATGSSSRCRAGRRRRATPTAAARALRAS